MSKNERNFVEALKDICSVMSTTKVKSAQKPSKGPKTPKMPLQTITRYFSKSPGLNQNAQVKISDTPGKESPTGSKPNSGGVCEVTMDIIDIKNRIDRKCYLLDDPLYEPDRRLSDGSSGSPPPKKPKLDEEKEKQIGNQEETNTSKNESQRKVDLSFDVSDDEAEKARPVIRQTKHCKHCDYNDKCIKRMRHHYKYRHPYIMCSDAYIQDSSDQSCSFCCLECPAEFASLANILKHYKANHPEDLGVFTLHSCQHDVAFGCLICPASASRMRALVKHYKNEHPKNKVDISLRHWRHFVRTRQEEESQLNTSEKAPGSEISRGASEGGSPPCQEGTTVSSPDVAFYNCSKCAFSHKSVIVLFVHYQKSHPDEAVTIDQLKRSKQGSSDAALQKLPEVGEESTHLKDNASSRKSEASKTHLEAQQNPQKGTSAADGRKGQQQPTAQHGDDDTSAGKHGSSDTSSNEIFYCNLCTFSSSQIRSLISHHKALHAREELHYTDMILYSQQMWKQLPPEKKTSHTSSSNAHECAEKLFFCQICNYAHVAVRGIIVHMSTVHQCSQVDRNSVLEYTASVRKDLQTSKSAVKGLPFTTNIPLPLLNEGDEDKLFCYLCNYRHRDYDIVYKHCFSRHQRSGTTNYIYLYSAMVLKQQKKKSLQCPKCSYKTQQAFLFRRHMLKTHNCMYTVEEVSALFLEQGTLEDSDEHSEAVDHHSEEEQSPVVGSPEPLAPASGTSGTSNSSNADSGPAGGHDEAQFRCRHCPLSFTCPFGIQTHCRLKHPDAEDKPLDVGRARPRGGQMRVFTCTYCSYVSSKRYGVITHCWMMHRQRLLTVGCYLQEQLEGQSPDATLIGYQCKTCQQIFTSVKHLAQHRQDSHEGEEEPSTTKAVTKITRFMTKHRAEKLSKAFMLRRGMHGLKCQLCSYKAVTKAGLLKHMRSCHKAEGVPASSHRCVLCTDVFPMKKLLGNHYVLKHGHKAYLKHFAEPSTTAAGNTVLVYKCPYCPYVNAVSKGILRHSQMLHRNLKIRAAELAIEEVLMSSVVGRPAGGASIIRGYLCPTCQQVHGSLNMLETHHEGEHGAALELSPAESSSYEQPEETRFCCSICDYVGYHRHSLFNHYYSTHKLDALTRKNLLQKYNRHKKKARSGPGPAGPRVGPRLLQYPEQLLLGHCHIKLDFRVLSPRTDKSSGVFRCCHCQKRLCGTRNLSSHLELHRARKRRAERTKAPPTQTSLAPAEAGSDRVSPAH